VVAGVHYIACYVCLGFHFGLPAFLNSPQSYDAVERDEGPELEVAKPARGWKSRPSIERPRWKTASKFHAPPISVMPSGGELHRGLQETTVLRRSHPKLPQVMVNMFVH
jgi:hypothetical protein